MAVDDHRDGRQDTERHAGCEELQAWVHGKLAEPASATLLGHVLRCAACRGRWAALAEGVLDAPKGAPAVAFPEFSYRRAIRRALERAAARLAEQERLEEADAEDLGALDGLGPEELRLLTGQLLHEAAELRAEDLGEAEETAYRAVLAAERIDEEAFGRGAVNDLRTQAWIEVANLRRARNNLDGAERAMAQAAARFNAGTGDMRLRGRYYDVAGSLHRDRCRFEEAEEAFDHAFRCYFHLGERHLAGRVKVKLSMVYNYQGQSWRAVGALTQSFRLLDVHNHPEAVLVAVHNCLTALADAGAAAEVAACLSMWRPIYERLGSPLDQVRRLGLEAKVAFAQDQPGRGASLFRQQIEGFEEAGLPYDAAVAALELAGLLCERGQTEEVLELLDGAVTAFVERQIHREVIALLGLVRVAVERGQASAWLIAEFAEELRELRSRG